MPGKGWARQCSIYTREVNCKSCVTLGTLTCQEGPAFFNPKTQRDRATWFQTFVGCITQLRMMGNVAISAAFSRGLVEYSLLASGSAAITEWHVFAGCIQHCTPKCSKNAKRIHAPSCCKIMDPKCSTTHCPGGYSCEHHLATLATKTVLAWQHWHNQ
jgi:hypothetical protein